MWHAPGCSGSPVYASGWGARVADVFLVRLGIRGRVAVDLVDVLLFTVTLKGASPDM
jgi:hypothetical protein